MAFVFEGVGTNLMMLWILFLMCPVFFMLGSVLAHSIEYAYTYTKSGNFFLGDISYMLPLSDTEKVFKMRHIILLTIFIVCVSVVMIASMIWATMVQKQAQKAKSSIEQEYGDIGAMHEEMQQKKKQKEEQQMK